MIENDHVHDYTGEVVEPTCTEGGYTVFTCEGCGDSFVDNYTDALGHDYAAVVTDPTCTELTDLESDKTTVVVNWKKHKVQTTGYVIQYSPTKNFSKNVKSVSIKNRLTTQTTLNNLKKKKTYYVRIRTYKVVKGVTYYSDWSKVEKIKTKK